jgi:hypothetical protein
MKWEEEAANTESLFLGTAHEVSHDGRSGRLGSASLGARLGLMRPEYILWLFR